LNKPWVSAAFNQRRQRAALSGNLYVRVRLWRVSCGYGMATKRGSDRPRL